MIPRTQSTFYSSQGKQALKEQQWKTKRKRIEDSIVEEELKNDRLNPALDEQYIQMHEEVLRWHLQQVTPEKEEIGGRLIYELSNRCHSEDMVNRMITLINFMTIDENSLLQILIGLLKDHDLCTNPATAKAEWNTLVEPYRDLAEKEVQKAVEQTKAAEEKARAAEEEARAAEKRARAAAEEARAAKKSRMEAEKEVELLKARITMFQHQLTAEEPDSSESARPSV